MVRLHGTRLVGLSRVILPPTTKRPNLVPSMSAHPTQDVQVTRDSPGRFVPCHPPANYKKTQDGPLHVSSPDPRWSGYTELACQVRPVSTARQLRKDPIWSLPCQLTRPKMVVLHGTRRVGLSRVILSLISATVGPHLRYLTTWSFL
jgi:hypothetical protein